MIEDAELLCETMLKLLCKHFPVYELAVYCAGDGLSGIKFAEKIQPDLIILDIVLPLLSGIEVYEKLILTTKSALVIWVIIVGV